jgi:hypothetical protein
LGTTARRSHVDFDVGFWNNVAMLARLRQSTSRNKVMSKQAALLRFSAARRVASRRCRIEPLEARALLITTLTDIATVGGQTVGHLQSAPATSGFASVGLVGDTRGNFCSGTLIDATHVLTAGHCADDLGDTQGRFTVGGRTYATRDVTLHPNYNISRIGSDSANDLAVFTLNQPVANVAPSPLFRGTPRVGDVLTLVGFGAGASGGTSHNGSFGVKRVGTTPIDGVSSRIITWRLDRVQESNTAPGDSGGPAFLNVGGVYYVAGVTSGGTLGGAGYGDRSFDSRVDAYASWIDSVVGSTTTVPPTPPPPVGDDHADVPGAGAASLVLNGGTGQVSGVLEETGDRDVFRLTVGQGGTATITCSAAGSQLDAYLRIYNSAGQQISSNDDSGGSTNSRVSVSLGAGVYYVSAGAYNDAGTGRYTVGVSLAADDHGDTRSTSTAISLNAAGAGGASGRINFAGDRDLFRFTAPRSGRITINLSAATAALDTVLAAYDSSGRWIAGNDDAVGTNSRLSLNVQAGRTYYLMASGYGNTTGQYSLSIGNAAVRSIAPIDADAVFASTSFRTRGWRR